jgi:TPP-dependent pyruvate/acetoin dehydrogenase alpha subunit
MLPRITVGELIAFEEDIAQCFNDGKIKAPVHLYNGNEREMIEIFEDVNEDDWVLCSWRSHYQCLLKGVPREWLKEDILAGRSISLCYKDYNIISSGIVGGILPIAVGIALDIQRKGGKNKVYCFMGDMTFETGIAHECIKYSIAHKLPVKFIVEDNGMSVCTDTEAAWGTMTSVDDINSRWVDAYWYKNKYPHAGAGKRIQF